MNESRYKKLVENLSEGICQVDKNGYIIFVNQSICEKLSYSAEEMCGRHIAAFVADTSKESVKKNFSNLKKEYTGQHRVEFLKKDGSHLQALITIKTLFDKNKNVTESIVAVFDVTEIHIKHQIVEETKSWLQSLLKLQTCYFMHLDLQGNYLYANEKYLDEFGYLYKKGNTYNYIGVNATESIYYKDIEIAAKVIEELYRRPNEVFQIDLRKPLENGKLAYTLWDFSFIKDEEGEPSIIQCIGIDYTERKEKEEQLEYSETKLKSILNSSNDGIVLLDTDYKVLLVNKKAVENAKLVFGKPIYESDSYLDFYSPADSIKLKKESAKVFNGEIITYQAQFNEYNFIITQYPVYLNNGKLLGMCITAKNIDSLIKAEAELRKTKLTYKLPLDTSNVGTWHWNAESDEFIMSEVMALILGRTTIGITTIDYNTWLSFIHADDVKPYKKQLTQLINKEIDTIEIKLRIKQENGDFIWVNYKGKVAKWTDSDKALLVTGIVFDITETKKAELMLNELYENTNRMNRLMTKREDRILELKEEINKLSLEIGRGIVYKSTR